MMSLPAGRFLIMPFPPFRFDARPFAAVILPPRLFFAMMTSTKWPHIIRTLIQTKEAQGPHGPSSPKVSRGRRFHLGSKRVPRESRRAAQDTRKNRLFRRTEAEGSTQVKFLNSIQAEPNARAPAEP
jgi:hypothetical protein